MGGDRGAGAEPPAPPNPPKTPVPCDVGGIMLVVYRSKAVVLPEPLNDRPRATPASEARDRQRFLFEQRLVGTGRNPDQIETKWSGIRQNKEWVDLSVYCTIR